VRAWLRRHERFLFHFTPTSCSWLNAVEATFAKLSKQRLNAASSIRSSISKPQSIASSTTQTKCQSPSLGPQTQKNHRRRQTGAPSVRFCPLALKKFPEKRADYGIAHSRHGRGWRSRGEPVALWISRRTGALTTADLFKNFPAATLQSGDTGTASGARIERGQKVNLRRLDGNNNVREILMVDGLRTPPSGNGICAVAPRSFRQSRWITSDVLVDGASATYGSDSGNGRYQPRPPS